MTRLAADTRLQPGDRVITPSGITGVYEGRAVTKPEWNWARIRTDQGLVFIYPVWLLSRSEQGDDE